jgi:general secretion pathway protein G
MSPLSLTFRRQRKPARGFTLIELMIAVVIIGILAAIIAPNVIGRLHDAKVSAAKQDVATLVQTLTMYKLDNARFPSGEQGLKALVEKPTSAPLPNNWRGGGYMPRLPNDPWGNAYQFANPGLHGDIDVYSFGADGKTGGDGEGADIGSWNL